MDSPHKAHGPEVVEQVKQMADLLLYKVQNGTLPANHDALEAYLVHLEENDESFYRYDAVKSIRSQIITALLPFMGDLADRVKDDSAVESLVSKFTASPQYHNLVLKMTRDIKLASASVAQQYDEQLCERPRVQSMSFEEDNWWDDEDEDDPHGLDLMMPQDELYARVCADLTAPSAEKQREGLDLLGKISALELINSEFWSDICTGLGKILAQGDPSTTRHAVTIIAKMFQTESLHVMRDVYIFFTVHVATVLRSSNILQTNALIETQDPRTESMLRQVRLFLHMNTEISEYWLRFGERAMVECSAAVSQMLLASTTEPGATSPLLFLSLLDVKGIWFKTWMGTAFSRGFLIEHLLADSRLVSSLLQGCTEFCVPQTLVYPNSQIKPASPTKTIRSNKTSKSALSERVSYSMEQCRFLYGSLCLHMVGYTLLYDDSRSLLPASFLMNEKSAKKCRRDNILPVASGSNECFADIHDLMLLLVRCMTSFDHSISSSTLELNAVNVIADLFKNMASNQSGILLLLDPEVIWQLHQPIVQLVKEMKENSFTITEQRSALCLHIGEIMSMIASSTVGRHVLLEAGPSNAKSPATTLATFVSGALQYFISHKELPFNREVVTAFLFTCRQLYSSNEGLLALQSFKLNMLCSRILQTRLLHELQYSNVDVFETVFVDNLLNFAGTPKGVQLLHQSGSMERCVTYMSQRFKLKGQVSKYDRFGYGVMLTQIGATVPGMMAIHRSGLIKLLFQELALVQNADDISAPVPHLIGKEPNLTKKALLYCFRICSFSAIQVLAFDGGDFDICQQFSHFLHPSLAYMRDKFHVNGIRILQVACASMDSFLVLEQIMQLRKELLELQQSNQLDSGEFIIDESSLLINKILISTSVVGGPSERLVPPVMMDDGASGFAYPLFNSLTIPEIYSQVRNYPASASILHARLMQLEGVLKESKHVQSLDLSGVYSKALNTSLSSPGSTNANEFSGLCCSLLQSFVRSAHSKTDAPLSPVNFKSIITSSTSHTSAAAVDLVTSYALRLRLIVPDASDKFANDYKAFNDQLHLSKEAGHDWFAASIYLLFRDGRASDFLQKYSQHAGSQLLWPQRMRAADYRTLTHPMYFVVCHHIERIVHVEVPLVSSAFRLSGYTESQICQQWLRQCFWNVLDWPEICGYFLTCMYLGMDYQVYYCVAILRHLQGKILQATHDRELVPSLTASSAEGFSLVEELEFMQKLHARFSESILDDLSDFVL